MMFTRNQTSWIPFDPPPSVSTTYQLKSEATSEKKSAIQNFWLVCDIVGVRPNSTVLFHLPQSQTQRLKLNKSLGIVLIVRAGIVFKRCDAFFIERVRRFA